MLRLQIIVPCVRDFVNFRSFHFRSLAIQKGFEFGSPYLFIALRKFLETLDLNSFSLNLHVSLRTLSSSSYRFRAIKLQRILKRGVLFKNPQNHQKISMFN